MVKPRQSSRETPARNIKWEGAIERLGWGGRGIARMEDGRLVLLIAQLAMFPGEEVRAVVRLRKQYAEGYVVEWVKEDPRRAELRCSFAEHCGGCALWGAGALTGDLKRMMVEDLLGRSLRDAPAYQWQPAPYPYKKHGVLRHRIQLHWDGRRLGFHRRATQDVVSVRSCPIAVDPVSRAIPALGRGLVERTLPVEPDRWELATGTPPSQVVATCGEHPQKSWQLTPDGWRESNVVLLNHQFGDAAIEQTAGGFFQVCPSWAWQAFGDVLTGWELSGATLFDLYGGVGFFSRLLSERFKRFVVVESSPLAIASAERNLAGLDAECIAGDVGKWCAGLNAGLDDTVLLDPPRSGLSDEIKDRLKQSAAGTLILVGCDGAMFCRDVNALAPEWRIEKLAALDLFPNALQVEFVGLLKRV